MTFKALLNWAYRRKAMDLIQCLTLPFKAIAAQLGYSAMTSCDRAFKAWTGQSPKNYRKWLLAAYPLDF